MRKLTAILIAGAALALLAYSLESRGVRFPVTPPANGLSVVTLNMAMETSVPKVLGEIRQVPALAQADIMLLQEVKDDSQDTVVGLAKGLNLQSVWSPAEGATDRGLAILSRYPLRGFVVVPLTRYDLRFHSRNRMAICATAAAPLGAFRVCNVHLDTRLNPRERAAQLEPVIRAAEEFAGPRIIGGDFNSNGFYWWGRIIPIPARNAQTNAIRDLMMRHGFNAGPPLNAPTFDYFGEHLDWVWVQGAQARETRVFPLGFSDHHALWANIEAGNTGIKAK